MSTIMIQARKGGVTMEFENLAGTHRCGTCGGRKVTRLCEKYYVAKRLNLRADLF